MGKFRERSIKFCKWFQKVWGKIPATVKVIIYFTIGSLLALLQEDLARLEVHRYWLIVIVGVNDIILFVVQNLTKRVSELKK